MNIEVYANSLVQDIMLNGNADADDAAKDYYPAYKKEDGTAVDAINTLGVDINGGTGGETGEAKTYTVSFNGVDTQSEEGYFTFGDGKHNFNSKFTGKYNDVDFTSGLKMEGSTLVQFTTSASTSIVLIVQSTWSDYTLKFDGSEQDVTTATTPANSEGVRLYTITGVVSGTHTIARGSGESGLFYVEVREAGTTGISEINKSQYLTPNTYIYNFAGQKVNASYKGLVICNGRKVVQK